MKPAHRPIRALILSAATLWAVTALGQGPGFAPAVPPGTIGSHQIDRFEAIRQLQLDGRSDPNNVANWVILGELAHEVALDLPQDQDDAYYRLSRDAYERALALDPNNNGLRAAVQFARDQEANAPAFDAQRRQGVATYLDARRREMAQNGVNPTIQVYETSNVAPRPIAQPGRDQFQPAQQAAPGFNAPTQTYRQFYNPQTQQAYGYNQYSNGYVPPANNAPANGQAAPPTTLRQLGQQLPGLLLDEARGARPR